MSLSVTCYPIPGKPKALRLCEAFAAGVVAAGGRADVCTRVPRALKEGAAVFYGVRPAVAHLWAQAKAERRDWWYLDNAYFDAARERYFRVTKNALQASGMGLISPAIYDGLGGFYFERLRELGVTVQPWRKDGVHILVCPQSDEFMRVVAQWPGRWLDQTIRELRQLTRRGLVIRRKGETRPLAQDLEHAWALVTHSSAAAVEAALAGVPVFVSAPCAARAVAMNPEVASFKRIEERPVGYDRRPHWAECLARAQWTVDEIAKGDAWTALNG